MTQIKQIGIIHSEFSEATDPYKMKEKNSTLEIFDEFVDGLYRLEESDYIQVIFDFHLSKSYQLKPRIYDGSIKGIFASRSPHRPSSIGVTTVKLIEKKENILRVTGLDAIDGTPLLDIKPHNSVELDQKQNNKGKKQKRINPRWNIIPLIRNEKLDELLINVGEIHGHFCPGLAMGVMAGVHLMNSMRSVFSDGMENLLAIVEINNCFVDGIQYITGCTIGNNSLIYRDYGKTAATLTKRDGSGLRVNLKSNFQTQISALNPRFVELFEKIITKREGTEEEKIAYKKESLELAFSVLKLKMGDLFTMREVQSTIPPFAPIEKSVICEKCGENVISSKTREKDGKKVCIPCSNEHFYEANGFGIIKKE